MFGGKIGLMELVIILVIVLLVFGAGKLPVIGEGLGKAISNFKKSVGGKGDDDAVTGGKAEKK